MPPLAFTYKPIPAFVSGIKEMKWNQWRRPLDHNRSHPIPTKIVGTGITFLESIILDLKKEYHPHVKFLPKNISHDRELVKPI